MQFRVCLLRVPSNPRPGIEFDFLDARVPQVLKMDPGPLAVQVRLGDFVLEVNGVRDDKGRFIDEFQLAADLDLVVARPAPFAVQLEVCGEGQAGFEVELFPNGRSLLVKRVHATGAAAEWNLRHEEEEQLLAHDRIVSVNGAGADVGASRLAELLAEPTHMELRVVRPRLVLSQARASPWSTPRCRAKAVLFEGSKRQGV